MAGEGKEFVPDGIGFTACEAVPATGTGQSRLPVKDIRLAECIVLAIACAGHAVGAGIINVHTERRDELQIIHQGSDGAPEDAVHHFAFSPGDKNYDPNPDDTKCNGDRGCQFRVHFEHP